MERGPTDDQASEHHDHTGRASDHPAAPTWFLGDAHDLMDPLVRDPQLLGDLPKRQPRAMELEDLSVVSSAELLRLVE